MDLSPYDLDVLLLAAIKSEIESKIVYSKLAKKVKNALLKDKLEFPIATDGTLVFCRRVRNESKKYGG